MLFFKNYWILWQNARNLSFIWEYNTNEAKELADSKLKTKDFLSKKWISVSDTIFTIKTHKELENTDLNTFETPFVIKPNAGYWWKWILIIDKKDSANNFITNNNESYNYNELKQHLDDILDGFYSLSWSRDKVIFERKIELDHSIDLLWKYWLPDIRVIVFNSVPVLAMLRIPTENSKWKANLHAWACWVWIDIWSWKLTYITQFKKLIKSIPWIWDVRWIELPHWDEILSLAVKTQQVSNIWYIWCDIVLDDKVGPMILEVNIRPWLEVQVANRIPLLARLEKVKNLKIASVEKWVRLWKDMFGWDFEEKIKNITGKKVLWLKEYIIIQLKNWTQKTISEIDITSEESYINKDFLVNFLKFDEKNIKNWKIKIKLSLLDENLTILFNVWIEKKSNIVIWKNELNWFLIDPFKYKQWDLPTDFSNKLIKEKNIVFLKWYEESLLKIDKELISIDKQVNLYRITTPNNIQTEKVKFIESEWKYIPKFEYNPISLNTKELLKSVNKIEIPDIPLSNIYERKKQEIINKILYLDAFLAKDIQKMNHFSKKLYWEISQKNMQYINNILHTINDTIIEEEYLTFDEIKNFIEKFNHIYWINLILKQKDMITRCVMSWDILYVASNAKIWKKEMRSIIAHEIEWHYLKKINGKKSKYPIFAHWTAGYLSNEEWIAINNQNRFLTKNDKKFYSGSIKYELINYWLNNSYQDLLKHLVDIYWDNYSIVFNKLYRLKRWIDDISKKYIDMRWVVYINWLIEINEFIQKWWNIKELYFWKIWIQDLEDIKKSDLIQIKTDDLKIPLFL